jgi:hypothetical protein
MSDIGGLEKRINQLEYYVSLNLLETKVKDLVIPSSVNPAINRFKNGFFVDNFDDYTVVDTTSKEFNATIEQSMGELYPRTKQYNLNLMFDRNDATTNAAIYANNSLMLPYTEEILIKQELATSTVNSDGNKTNYAGSMLIAPSTFRLLARGEVQIIPDPQSGGGDGGGWGTQLFGSSRGYSCVVATELANQNNGWSRRDMLRLMSWSLNKLDDNWIGRTLHKGYQVVGPKLLIPIVRKRNTMAAKYIKWSFDNSTNMLQGKKFNLLSIPNSAMWLAVVFATGLVVTKEYATNCLASLNKRDK